MLPQAARVPTATRIYDSVPFALPRLTTHNRNGILMNAYIPVVKIGPALSEFCDYVWNRWNPDQDPNRRVDRETLRPS